MSFSSKAKRHSVRARAELAAQLVGPILMVLYSGRSFGQTNDPQIAQHEQAAAQGSVDAEIWLGQTYFAGKLVGRDYAKALAWYKKAADQGNAVAEISVGSFYVFGWGVTQDYAQGLTWIKKAADQGNAVAESHIGTIYRNGWGVPQDFAQARAWYEKAAAQGNADAETSLGYFYFAGKGTAQDYAQSLAWYRKAADQGNAVAEDSVGNAYRNGWGVQQDYAQALGWYEKGAAQGNADAEAALGHAYWAGQGVAQDYAQSLAWYRKAADQGNAVAEDSVGNAYRNGWGVAQDLSQAAAWYQKAISGGYAQATQDLANIQSQVLAAQATPPAQSEASGSQSAAEWQQDHQAKVDELTQEIASHERQAQQDEADAEQAEAQEEQNASANVGNGPGSAFLQLGNVVQGTLSAGLAEKMHQEAAEERGQADEERQQLAELGAEQPPVSRNNSEAMALTRMQTQMIQSGDTIQGAVNRELGGLLGGQQAAAEQRQPHTGQIAQQSAFSPPRSDPISQSPAASTASAPISGSGPSGIVVGGSSGCTDMNIFVTATTRVNPDGVVVGFLTNNSNQTLYVNFAFTRGGAVETSTAGAVTVRPGQTIGGEGGGVWATTSGPSGVDSNPPGIHYSAWLQSEEDAHPCTVAW